MPCASANFVSRQPGRRIASRATIIFSVIAAVYGRSSGAQQPAAPPPSAYRPPTITLVVPIDGAPIPADKPVVLLRFAAGDSSDAIDPTSLVVSVDGADRTRLLQLGKGEAWGPLAPDSAANASPAAEPDSLPTPVIATGVHFLHVRICSQRGVCGMLDTPITVIPVEPVAQSGKSAEPDSSARLTSPVSLIRMLLELVMAIARKLIAP